MYKFGKQDLLRYTALTALIPVILGGVAAKADEVDTIVVTGTAFNAELAAPAKASLETRQPETIINRPYIEDFVTPTADYTTLLSIAPSLTGTDPNGPGLSDNGVKPNMRGIPDGSYGMSYDNIPFGDTNGPSHHSASYFPSTTVGSVLVDRGPGNAGTLGAATYGGTIKLFSEPLSDDMHARGLFTYGSFNTRVESANLQTGALFDGAARIMLNAQNTYSDGALTLQDFEQTNFLAKFDFKVGDNWTVTVFGTYNYLEEHLNDNAGSTPAQVAAYGKNFALQDNNPVLSTYNAYAWTTKKSDMDYIRFQGTVLDGLEIDDEMYTYFYTNHTFSSRSTLQTAADIAANTTQGQGGKLAPIVGGVAQPNDVPGYYKLNQYRVWGNILRLTKDYDFGAVKGEVRAGLWYEGADTPRARYDYDITKCTALGIDPFRVGNKAASACQDTSLVATKKAVMLADGPAEFNEHSNWVQYQPFLEVDIEPIDGLTITPGVKYLDWNHKTKSVLEPKLLKPYQASFRTTDVLPFAEAHYKITSSWSVYAQYAEGIYSPDVGVFENATPTRIFPDAQTTTNYQVGTVFYADQFSFDADLYDIEVNNNYSTVDCVTLGGPAGDTCFVNTGHAQYRGVEGEATYAFGGSFMGLSTFVNGSIMSSKSGGLWLQNAPAWTQAAGVIYKAHDWKFSLVEKTVGPQYSDNAQTQAYKLSSYTVVDATIGYALSENIELSANANNLFDSRKIASIKIGDKTVQANQLNSLNQLFFQAPRSVLGTMKIRW